MTKAGLAREACARWERDWGGLKGSPEPTARQIIRATASCGWYGHSRQISEVYQLPMSGGWVSCRRPARVRVYENGGMSMISDSTANTYADMANLERARRLIARYQRFREYMTETRHAWRKVRDHYYADNSIEREEVSELTGKTRMVHVLAAGGDLCF